MTLQDAVKEERYHEACKLKKELDSVRTRLMRKLEGKILRQVTRMRIANERKLQASFLETAKHQLATALAEEDYAAAARAQLVIKHEEERSRHGRLSRIAKWLDWAWLVTNMACRVYYMRAKRIWTQRDRSARLESALRKAVEDDAFEQAAVVRDALCAETLRHDIKAMYASLARQLSSKGRWRSKCCVARRARGRCRSVCMVCCPRDSP